MEARSTCITSIYTHTHPPTHTFLPFSCRFTATRPPQGGGGGGRAKLEFPSLVRSAIVDSQPSTTSKPSTAHCTLRCSTLFTHRLLSFQDALVTLLVAFPSKGSLTFVTLYLVAWMFLGFLLVASSTQAFQSLLVGCSPSRPRY